jgi:hypothetical protein
MKRVCRHIEYKNIILFIEKFEFDRMVAFMAIEYKKPIFSNITAFNILFEMLNLL